MDANLVLQILCGLVIIGMVIGVGIYENKRNKKVVNSENHRRTKRTRYN